MQTIQEILRNARTDRNLTLREVSKATGINSSTLNAWERGAASPRARNRRIIAKYYALTEEQQTVLGQRDMPPATPSLLAGMQTRPIMMHEKSWNDAEMLMTEMHVHDISSLLERLVSDRMRDK